MNKSELAEKLLEWETKKKELDQLEDLISHEVMILEESFTVGDITAKLNSGRRNFDYESGGNNVSKDIIERNTKVETKVETKIDWKAICKEGGVKDIPFTTGNPSVTISIKKDKPKIEINEEELPF